MPFVSIIIPTYNRAYCIRNAIDSALSQTFSDMEIIVVDDGSTDDTPQALRPYQNRIRYIRQENAGVCAARNCGISNSRGEWIAFLDSDDEWLPTKLDTQIRNIKDHPEVCLHATNAFLISEEDEETDLFSFTGFATTPRDCWILERPLSSQIRFGVARIQCMMVRRTTLFAAGLFRMDHPIPLYEDHDLACRLALQGPWFVSNQKMVRIVRRKEEKINLSQLRTSESIRSAKTLVQIYDRLMMLNNLNTEEKSLVHRVLNEYRGMLAMRLLGAGQQGEAWKIFFQSFRTSPSARSIAKLALATLPLGIAPKLAKQWNLYRG